jgi:C-terminal processing protease CtpA/Prc
MAATRTLLSALLAFLFAAPAVAETPAERLAALGRVWGLVKHAHPYLGSSDLDWDGAAVRAIDSTLAARDARAFAAATQEMLAVLGDPATRVQRTCVATEQPQTLPDLTAPGTLYVRPGDTPDPEAIRRASHVVFDLRPLRGRCSSANAAQLAAVAPLLFSGTIAAPAQRKVAHNGYRSHDPRFDNSRFYNSDFVVEPGATFTGTATGARTTTFVVDERSTLPAVAAAMVQAGQASILSIGPYRDLDISLKAVPLEGGYEALIRTSESLPRIAARTTLPADASEGEVFDAALASPPGARRRAARGPAATSVRYTWRADKPYEEMKYPDVAYRVLAAFRYWNAIEFFYAYKHLIGDWPPRLAAMIDLFIAAKSQTEYELALAEASTWVPDGHSFVIARAKQALTAAAPPFQTFAVEGKVVVTALTNEAATAAGIRPGDELLAIDGRPIEERLAQLRKYTSASTPANLEAVVAYNAPRGANGSEVLMRFRRPDGSEYETRVTRSSAFRSDPPAPPANWRVLPGNIGYVDLGFLTDEEIPAMMRDLAGTRAIIFDMRLYPRSSFGPISRWTNVKNAGPMAQIRVPQVIGGDISEAMRMQTVGTTNTPLYRGKTFMLIGERTQSAAEHYGLALEASSGVTFVGTATAGANGNVTMAVLPGENSIMFGGMDVRHADGRQLQRVGLLPHVEVHRTVAGLAAGRDEVLEQAIALALAP